MGFFNLSAVERAKRCLDSASRDAECLKNNCTLARVNLEDTGRQTEAVAIEMICASVTQLQRDITRWREILGRPRAEE